ncbi:phage tail domain-containing protein [Cellulomonas sp. C5510]|uniref:phage tail domain-containing protein n=1 Tax=Cellulomonas sp. C5510 TaxID=2871170 RepID=UPI001C979A2E|nr:phage tail domain-containing protein [Cellulomonas sp. C5510]QZN86607.1 phage tail family protein [Cellulomonas sp. C5510]
MNTSRLTLSGGGVVVDLSDHLDRHPSGGTAVLDDGLDGLGLPPVSPRFFDGAGDGSTYRGARVQPRDITLPVLITATGRNLLRERVSALATVLSPVHAPARLTYTEPDGTAWTADVVRTGSGAPVTDGVSHYAVDLGLRSADPYWTRENAASHTIESAGAGRGLLRPGASLSALRLASGQVIGDAVIENPGDAPAYPVVTLTGPATQFELTSPTGERLLWSGTLEEGERRVFDHLAGTVVDDSGTNCYAELGAAPRFWAIPPGVQTAHVDVAGSSVGRVVPVDPPLRTNLVPDPRARSLSSWVAGAGAELDLGDGVVRMTATAGTGATARLRRAPDAPDERWEVSDGDQVAVRVAVANPGEGDLVVRLRTTATLPDGSPASSAPGTPAVDVRVALPAGAHAVLEGVGTHRSDDATHLAVEVAVLGPADSAPAPGDAVTLGQPALLLGPGAPTALPVPYFDGATAASSGRVYAWAGTPDSSPSVERATAVVGRTSVSVAWKPRRWFML